MVSAGFSDLKFIDNEIFAQARKTRSGRSFQQIGQRSMKELFIGKHGQRGCSATSKLVGQRSHGKRSANRPL